MRQRPSPVQGPARSLLDAAPNMVVLLDASELIRYVNPVALSRFGYAMHEVLGQHVSLLLPDSTAGAALAGDQLARDRSGARFPVEARVAELSEPDGAPTAVIAMIDLTARVATEAHLRELSRVYRTLAEVNEAIVRATEPKALYREISRIVAQTGAFLGAWVGQRGRGEDIEVVACHGALEEYVSSLRLTVRPDVPVGRGPTARALRDGECCYTDDFLSAEATAPWWDLASRHGVAASATLPLREGGRPVAALTIYAGTAGAFSAELRRLLEGVADNVSFALDGLATTARLQELLQQRRVLLERLLEAQELERARIAGDVHDEPVQTLAAADLRLGLLERRVRRVAPELVDDLAVVQRAVGDVARRLRSLLFDLEPVGEQVPLEDALRDAAGVIFAAEPVRWSVVVDGEIKLPAAERTKAMRIAKEALRNVQRHAKASTVRISLRPLRGGVEIAVADDGVGAGQDTWVSPPGHRGLGTMRDRAAVVGGWLRLEAAPGGGTVVRFWLPGEEALAGPAGAAVQDPP